MSYRGRAAPWRQQTVAAVLRHRGPMTVEQLRVVLGGSYNAMSRVCKLARDAGMIVVAGEEPSAQRGPNRRLYGATHARA